MSPLIEGDLSDLCAQFLKSGDASISLDLADRFLEHEFALFDIVTECRSAFLDEEDGKRRERATRLLRVVVESSVEHLTKTEIVTLEDFFLTKLGDWQCLEEGIDSLTCIVKRSVCVNREKIAQGIFQRVVPSSYNQSIRYKILQLMQLIELKNIVPLKEEVGDGLMWLVDDERDPRNLLICFELINECLQLPDNCVSEEALEKYFDHVTSYFPIDFRPPKNDPKGITRKQLRTGLRQCFAASHRLAIYTMPFLILASKESMGMKSQYKNFRDCLKTIQICLESYSAEQVRNFLPSIYDVVSELSNEDKSIKQQKILWMTGLERALSDVPSGVYPNWIHNDCCVPVHLEHEHIVETTAATHPALYDHIWSTLSKDNNLTTHPTLAERIFNAQHHQNAKTQLGLIEFSDRTCGLITKIFTKVKDKAFLNESFKTLCDKASPSTIMNSFIKEKKIFTLLDRTLVTEWINNLSEETLSDGGEIINFCMPLLPESTDIIERCLEEPTPRVFAALEEEITVDVAEQVHELLPLWNIATQYRERFQSSSEDQRALMSFAIKYVKNLGEERRQAVVQDLSDPKLWEEDIRAYMILLPAIVPFIENINDVLIQKCIDSFDDETMCGAQEALRLILENHPEKAKLVTAREDVPAVRALAIRVMVDKDFGEAQSLGLLSTMTQDRFILERVMKDISSMTAQRILYQFFETASLSCKIILLDSCPMENDGPFKIRETILMGLEQADTDIVFLKICSLILRFGVKEFSLDLESVVPHLVQRTKLPHKPIIRLAALQVLDKIITRVELRHTSNVRNAITNCFQESIDDGRRTIRSYAATLYSKVLTDVDDNIGISYM